MSFRHDAKLGAHDYKADTFEERMKEAEEREQEVPVDGVCVGVLAADGL